MIRGIAFVALLGCMAPRGVVGSGDMADMVKVHIDPKTLKEESIWAQFHSVVGTELDIASASDFAEVEASEPCSQATNLAQISSPYTSHTNTGHNVYHTCGRGYERIFYYDMPAGGSLSIHQESNDFDSKHELRFGGSCPGEHSVQCIDDPDETVISWTNDQNSFQRVYFIVDSFQTDASGSFTLQWSISVPPSCNAATNLAQITSPHADSTIHAADDHSSCGSGSERIFYYDLTPGSSINIRQSNNDYDSKHETRWGGACPGVHSVQCTDDPDETQHSWTNDQNSPQRVYFIVDAYSTSNPGSFTLEWTIELPTPSPTLSPTPPTVSPTASPTISPTETPSPTPSPTHAPTAWSWYVGEPNVTCDAVCSASGGPCTELGWPKSEDEWDAVRVASNEPCVAWSPSPNGPSASYYPAMSKFGQCWWVNNATSNKCGQTAVGGLRRICPCMPASAGPSGPSGPVSSDSQGLTIVEDSLGTTDGRMRLGLPDGVEVVLTNLTEYKPFDANENGLVADSATFAQLSVACGSTVGMVFSFVQDAVPQTLDAINFTIADLDTGTHGRCSESVHVTGYTDYSLYPSSSINFTDDWFVATKAGSVDDNPQFIEGMTDEQKNSAVTFSFRNTGSFSVVFSTSEANVTSADPQVIGYAGRRILFGFGSP